MVAGYEYFLKFSGDPDTQLRLRPTTGGLKIWELERPRCASKFYSFLVATSTRLR